MMTFLSRAAAPGLIQLCCSVLAIDHAVPQSLFDLRTCSGRTAVAKACAIFIAASRVAPASFGHLSVEQRLRWYESPTPGPLLWQPIRVTAKR